MTDRKYQIFISSTYSDLQEERTQLLFAILKLNYIPAGMEFFSAIDEEQMQYIRRIIDESDYYVLLMGARYGSMDSVGVSYTEREYDYAVNQGKKIIALIHRNPDNIERGKTDKDEKLFKKFLDFRTKVIDSGRLVSFWSNATELITSFQASVIQTIQRFPATGWMRGDIPANAEMLQKIATLELENQRLKESLKRAGAMQIATDIKMEARSATTLSDFSENEIECVSYRIKYQKEKLNTSLFKDYSARYDTNSVIHFFLEEALPWFVQMAKICRIDLKISNPYPFPMNNIEWEDYLIDQDGNNIVFPDRDSLISKPPNLPYTSSDHLNSMSPQGDYRFSLNPKRSRILNQERFFLPDKNQDVIYQCMFFAESIIEPVEKTIKVHYRINEIECNFNELLSIVRDLYEKGNLNDYGVYELIKSNLAQYGKNQA